MQKMWAGRSDGRLNPAADDFNSSLRIDRRMYAEDIRGSMAHAAMLGAQRIITEAEAEAIIAGLEGILADIDSGALVPDAGEDIHMFVEAVLTERIGDAGKRLHTARSRNDQVALDIRLYLRGGAAKVERELRALITLLCDMAEKYAETIMPGYTHMQRAQPVTFGHHLMAYAGMFSRDMGRVSDGVARMNYSPLGSCALAGTTYPTDRAAVARSLEFDGVVPNSLDGVSDRDFCIELASAFALIMMHLSRFSEELVLWSSSEFGFVEADDSFSTGSSIMPQKKNPDIAELVRGKCGRSYGDLVTLLTLMKGLPLAYNKDMQEDKEAIFDSLDTVLACLGVFTPMLASMKVNPDRMRRAAATGFINATDCADYLVYKGMPFRDAYKITGRLVRLCIERGTDLESLPLSDYRQLSELFGEDVYEAINLEHCARARSSEGGTSPESVRAQVAAMRRSLK